MHAALTQLRADLSRAFHTPKCRKCGCLRDTLLALRERTAEVDGQEAEAVRADITTFLAGMEPVEYACLGCDTCHPAVADNRFHSAAEEALPLREASGSSCTFAMATASEWPVVAGEVIVVDPSAPVAVCTLASVDLPQEVAAIGPQDLALLGKTETENIGLDKIIQNVVTNPCLRVLLVAGEEPHGHLSGQALLALAANGVDEKRRIIGARGKRPFLRNVATNEIDRFRQQIEVVDLIGCEDAEQIAEQVEARATRSASECVSLTCGCGAQRSLEPTPLVPHVHADNLTRITLDKAGYFVVLPQPHKGALLVEHYDYHDRLLHVIEGEDARSICATLVQRRWVSQLDHAAYLGRELMRAELSLRLGTPFVQDGA